MSGISTSALRPTRALSLALLLALAAALPTRAPLEDEVRDAAPLSKPQKVLRHLLGVIDDLNAELCGKYNCESSKDALMENSLSLPKMTDIDGCFQSGFNQDTCLIRITTGLLEFQIYLEYLQNVFKDDKKNARDMLVYTKNLVQLLKQNVKNLDEIPTPDPSHKANVLSRLQSQSGWLQNTTLRLMLQSLKDFLQFSLRAIRIM